MPLMQSQYTITLILDEDDLTAIAAWYGQVTCTPDDIRNYLHQAAEDQLGRDRDQLDASLA